MGHTTAASPARFSHVLVLLRRGGLVGLLVLIAGLLLHFAESVGVCRRRVRRQDIPNVAAAAALLAQHSAAQRSAARVDCVSRALKSSGGGERPSRHSATVGGHRRGAGHSSRHESRCVLFFDNRMSRSNSPGFDTKHSRSFTALITCAPPHVMSSHVMWFMPCHAPVLYALPQSINFSFPSPHCPCTQRRMQRTADSGGLARTYRPSRRTCRRRVCVPVACCSTVACVLHACVCVCACVRACVRV